MQTLLLLAQDAAEAAQPADSHRESIWFWLGFGAFVAVMLLLDLVVFHKKPHEVKTKEAIGWSIFWIALALAFNVLLLWIEPPEVAKQRAGEFFAAYVLEKSLSVDNLFVIILIFQFFKVPGEYQHRILFLGILGAIFMRLGFILGGAALLENFKWMAWVFGGILILTGAKLAFGGDEEKDPSKSWMVRLVKRTVPYVDEMHGSAMTVVKDGKRYATPLLLVLIVIELTDLVFAVDSVPACLAITQDTFIVFTSNIFAILGLRALYFLLARFMSSFHYLKYGLAVVLVFVGVKMVLMYWKIHVPTAVSLSVIVGVLGIATVASLMRKQPHDAAPPPQA
ncbi:MAG: putative membrane-bound redox modulator Alx [Planctomycetes bacterium]|nr:putative membrane-bound redox modulator Alx [Planctomycetota bacterium]